MNGGRTTPLKTKVEYTRRANPTTWSHLKVSQPRNSEMIQMKSVLHVSMVDRAVALTLRVTERPKKLKQLDDILLAPHVCRSSDVVCFQRQQ